MSSGIEIPIFYVSEFPDYVNVIAITKDQKFIIIVEQYRHGIQRICFELCVGDIRLGEGPLLATQRELLEETGFYRGEWTFLESYAPNASGATNFCHSFLAKDVEKHTEQQLEITEDIKVHLLSEKELRIVIENG